MDEGSKPAASGDRSLGGQAAPSIFERFSDRDVLDLIAEYPLAWLCTPGGDPDHASLLPLLAKAGDDGRLASLLGHMARRNPLVGALRRDCRALLLFTGPHGYLSPELVSDRNWAPTWNYAQVRIEAELQFEEAATDAALEALVSTMERDRERPWTVAEMGKRYPGMARAVIAFSVRPVSVKGRFKLGQDEKPHVLAEILHNRPADDLSRWMTRFNEHRIAKPAIEALEQSIVRGGGK